jgi:2-methylisocitrate lyase-like PEP mutase family enzyme
MIDSYGSRLREEISHRNQIRGGKSVPCNLRQLEELGVKLVIYSTPCLFAAQGALEEAMHTLKENDGDVYGMTPRGVALAQCSSILNSNLTAGRQG